jgi:hypothetical protein
MSALLAEAVSKLPLAPGQTYQAVVAGCEVQIHRPAATPAAAASPPTPPSADEERSQFEDMVMLDPWFDLGDLPSPNRITVQAKFGPMPLPDPPVIPPNDELPEDEISE